MPRGEWWIDDDGQATFADGDVGDMNHEGYAFWSFIGLSDEEAPESVSPNGIDLTALGEDMLSDLGVRESIVDVGEWDDEKWAEFLSDNDLDPFDENEGGYSWSREEVLGLNRLVGLGANMDFVWWWHQSSQQDSREYAIEVKNWIRVQGDHFEMHTFDEDALDRIRGADLWEQEGDPEALEMSEDLVYLNERKTGKFFSVPLKVLFDTSRSYVDIMNYGERGQEGGEEHLALNPRPQIETYSAVGDNMKGLLNYDGDVVAWEVNSGGEPHHDDIADLMNIQYVAKMTFDMSRSEMYVDTMSPAFSSVTQSAVRSFTGYSKDTSLLVESGTGRLRTTVNGYFSLLRHAPDPDDYDEGESDAEYEKDTRDYVDRINSTKTASELLGREKSPEHAEADDPHVHLALNPTYMSYGHREKSKIWIWKRGFLIVRDFDPDVGEGHYEQFGDDTQKSFFGRYDPYDNVITIAPPGGNPFAVPPQALLDELEMEFGSSARIMEFNPAIQVYPGFDEQDYTDIGHGENGISWVWDRDGRKVLRRRHQANEYWIYKGRYDPDTHTVSVYDADHEGIIPEWLLIALEQEFGGGLQALAYNPIKVKPESEYDPKELALGIEVEKEHSNSYKRRSITARQHLEEDPRYYTKLKKAGLNPPKKKYKIVFSIDWADGRHDSDVLSEGPFDSEASAEKHIECIRRNECGYIEEFAANASLWVEPLEDYEYNPPAGDCFRWATMHAHDYPDAEVVHGVVHSVVDGHSFDHAWIESHGRVYDWHSVEKMGAGDGYDLSRFYELLNPEQMVRYSPRDAVRSMVREKHHGPWHKNPPDWKRESNYDEFTEMIPIETALAMRETDSLQRRSITARQHLEEDPHYYTKLKEAGLNPPPKGSPTTNPTVFAYRVHFFDGWHGKNRSMDTTAPSPAKATSNVRYRIAAERGVPLATLPSDMYVFKRVEQLG